MPEVIDIDVSKMTIGEIEEAEGMCGRSIMPVISRGDFPASVLAALVTVSRKRTDPTFTYADARKITLGELKQELTSDPTPPAGEGANPSN